MFNNYKRTKKLIKFTTKHLSKDVWNYATSSDSYFDLYCTNWENLRMKSVYIRLSTLIDEVTLIVMVDFVNVLHTFKATHKDFRTFKRLIRKLSENKL